MSAWIRSAAPFLLLALALLAWFEQCIPGSETMERHYGAAAVLRFVVGCLCVFVAMLMLEAQHKNALLKQLLEQFRRLADARRGSGTSAEPTEARREAIRILASALEASDEAVRQNARDHLTRLVGEDLGPEPGPWLARLDEESERR